MFKIVAGVSLWILGVAAFKEAAEAPSLVPALLLAGLGVAAIVATYQLGRRV